MVELNRSIFRNSRTKSEQDHWSQALWAERATGPLSLSLESSRAQQERNAFCQAPAAPRALQLIEAVDAAECV